MGGGLSQLNSSNVAIYTFAVPFVLLRKYDSPAGCVQLVYERLWNPMICRKMMMVWFQVVFVGLLLGVSSERDIHIMHKLVVYYVCLRHSTNTSYQPTRIYSTETSYCDEWMAQAATESRVI